MIWKASFVIKNYIFESPMTINYKPFTSEIKYEILPNNKGTKVSIVFDTEVSKPPALQRRKALILLSAFKEISAPFIGEAFDTELVELIPASEKDRKEYDKIEVPDDLFFASKPKIVRRDIIEKIQKSFSEVLTSKPVISLEELPKYQSLVILRTMLRWYNRGLESKNLLDKFISLWVTFNVIYDSLWRRDHPKGKRPTHSDRILDCICRTLNEDECKQILEPYEFILPDQMPPYELIGTRQELDELIKSKDIKKIEANHKKFLDKEKQDLGFNKKDLLVYTYGLDFGKYWYTEDWISSLAQVLLHTYGVRNSVFHSGEIPLEEVPDSYQFWTIRNDILCKVNALLLVKILA